MARSNVDIVS